MSSWSYIFYSYRFVAIILFFTVYPKCVATHLIGDPWDSTGADEATDGASDDFFVQNDHVEAIDITGEEDRTFCGNNIRELGEECDGESRECLGLDYCGGGIQTCNEDCTWSECTGAIEFGIVAGPIIVSDNLVVESYSTSQLWDGSFFNLFFLAKTEPDAIGENHLYHSVINGIGEIESPPSNFTPASLREEYGNLYYLNIINNTGINPFAMLTLSGSSRNAVFNYVSTEGNAVFDPGMVLWRDAYDTTRLLVSGEGGYVVSLNTLSDEYKRFVFFDSNMELSYTYYPECCTQNRICYPQTAVADDEDYRLFWFCCYSGIPDCWIRSQSFDSYGNPMSEDRIVLENRYYDRSVFLVVLSDSVFGVLFSEVQEVSETLADLYFFVVDTEVNLLMEPQRIGAIYNYAVDSNADMVWTGSEYGIAFAEPLSDSTETDWITKVTLVRLSTTGATIGEPLEVDGSCQSHSVKLEWSGSYYGISWNEPLLPDFESTVHFALVGCNY